MFFIYRFLGCDDSVLYIGKTNNLDLRITQHFSNGHLRQDQYDLVSAVEYMELATESDQHISEIYLINKYKPPFNSRDKKLDGLTVNLDLEENWILKENRHPKGCAHCGSNMFYDNFFQVWRCIGCGTFETMRYDNWIELCMGRWHDINACPYGGKTFIKRDANRRIVERVDPRKLKKIKRA